MTNSRKDFTKNAVPQISTADWHCGFYTKSKVCVTLTDLPISIGLGAEPRNFGDLDAKKLVTPTFEIQFLSSTTTATATTIITERKAYSQHVRNRRPHERCSRRCTCMCAPAVDVYCFLCHALTSSIQNGGHSRSNPYQTVQDYLSNIGRFKIIESTLRG